HRIAATGIELPVGLVDQLVVGQTAPAGQLQRFAEGLSLGRDQADGISRELGHGVIVFLFWIGTPATMRDRPNERSVSLGSEGVGSQAGGRQGRAMPSSSGSRPGASISTRFCLLC